MKQKEKQLGFQAPKSSIEYRGFTTINIDGLHYCKSHDFWFNDEEYDKLLHFGVACFYTDSRYKEGNHNYFKSGYLYFNRRKPLSIKSALRRIRKTHNLPVGTIVEINHSHYGIGKKGSYSLAYNFKVKKENKLDLVYEVNKPSFSRNFSDDDKAKNLTDLLRANGFLVKVTYDVEDGGDYAIAYGHGFRVGYSSFDNTLFDYSYGMKSILYDKWDEFDKWSRCYEIPKTLDNQEILETILKHTGEE